MRKRVTEDHQKLLITEDALKDRARAWYEAQRNPFIDFLHFKNRFLKAFYSLEARAEMKNRWSTRKYQSSDGTFAEYFTEQRRLAKYFDPPMDSYETNYYIIKQLPPRAREILLVVNYSYTDLILQALGRLDTSRKESGENKKVGDLSVRGSASEYRSSNQQPLLGSAVNYIREENRGRSDRQPRGYEQPVRRDDRKYDRGAINENWRDRGSRNFALPDTMRPPPNLSNAQINNMRDINPPRKETVNNNPNISMMRALQRSEFIKDLCWDVDGIEDPGDGNSSLPVINP